MRILKFLLPAAAVLALAACSTVTQRTADGATVQKTFIGKWEVRAKDPFRTEEGPIEHYWEEASAPKVAAAAEPRR